MNRRETCLLALLGIAGWLAAGPALRGQADPAAAALAPVTLSPVIQTENPDVVQRFAVNAGMARSMVDRAILKLTSASDLGTAWTRLGITPQDIVGIKITTMGGPLLSSHWAVVEAICDGLRQAGLPASHIIIWDKFGDDMTPAGYRPMRATEDRPGIASVFPGTGYDPTTFYKNDLIGTLIWGDSEFITRDPEADLIDTARAAVANRGYGGGAAGDLGDGTTSGGLQTSLKSYYANLVTRICTKIINVPVLTDNAYVGINGCLASLALGCVDNNRRFQGEPSFGDPAICEILDKDFIRRKVILHVLDALVAEYAGGPVFNPQFTESIGALYVSRDPVAIDSIVLPRLERWRRLNHIDPIGKRASHIQDAAFHHLGTDDPSRIQLIKLP
jgi:hypothetical protein